MKNLVAVMLFLLGMFAFSAEGSNLSTYTSLEYKGYKNYRLFITSDDREWID